MTAPRWTIDDDGDLDWKGEGKVTAYAVGFETDREDLFEADDGLKAAVRDAGTLTQIRELLNRWEGDTMTGRLVLNDMAALLDEEAGR